MTDPHIANKYSFKISVVMAIYGVEEFLREAIDSMINQTIGFLDNIQLVLVDDGSPDKSGEICDEYASRYPQNIVVIHKENGGAASARNEGLRHTAGQYINFCDPDDKLSENAFECMYNFIESNKDRIDVVTMPLYFFGAEQGPHWRNSKFDSGTRIIDLKKEYRFPLLSTAASLFSADKKEEMYFDTVLPCAEDAKMLHGVIFDKMAYGVVAECRYYYRKRHTGSSIMQTVQRKRTWYFDYFYSFFNWLDEESERRFGESVAYVQYLKAEELQSRYLVVSSQAEECLSPEEYSEYKELIYSETAKIDDAYIMALSDCSLETKIFMLSKKYGVLPSLFVTDGDIRILCGECDVSSLSSLSHKLNFAKISEEFLCIEGYASIINTPLLKDARMSAFGAFGRAYATEISYENSERKSFGEPVSGVLKFKFEIPIKNIDKTDVEIAIDIGEHFVKIKSFGYGSFFPISNEVPCAYYCENGYVMTLENERLCVRHTVRGEPKRLERRLNDFLRKSDLPHLKKAYFSRKIALFLRKIKKKPLWIISDRRNKGDDNGEALFKYLLASKKKNKVHFIYTVNSGKEYDRIKKYGGRRVVARDSKLYKIYHLLADCIISSHAEDDIRNPFIGYSGVYADIMSKYKYVFLQHGVTLNDLSGWLKRENKDISLFMTVAERERDAIINGNYGYTEKEVKLTGFPRHDLLYRNEKRVITVMPTWRKYLMSSMDARGVWSARSGFCESDYFKYFNALLNDERLLSSAEKYGYKISFMPHPNVIGFIDEFNRDERVIFRSPYDAYRDVLAEADMLVTDYSSVAFDFAYLRKPILYTQFDRDEFFSGKHLRRGYFDYERDGFGEIEYDLDSTVSRIVEYMKNGCALKEKYNERINGFFAYCDTNNSERAFNAIYALCEEEK